MYAVQNMRINWVIQHFYPETGGAETHAREICKHLVLRGHEVTVHTSGISFEKERLPLSGKVDGIGIVRYKPLFNLNYFITLIRPVITEGDIIVLEGYPSLTNDFVTWRYKDRAPIIIYPLGVVQPNSGLSLYMRRSYDRLLGIRTLKRANNIIALTEVESQWCSQKGMDPMKIAVVPGGIPEEAFDSYDDRAARDRYGLDRYILFIGRMYHEKAPLDLVNALSTLKDDYPDVGIIFAGPDQGEADRVRSAARESGMENRIVIAGKVSGPEKYELLAGCEFFALPSKFEAQGLVFIEAWAQKKAVIGTRVGGVPFVIDEGETGFLYDSGNINALAGNMRYLLNNPDNMMAIGLKGFQKAVSSYRWPQLVDQIEKIYQDAVDRYKKS
jgi:glycosyltransferase involved in cell wall biosynthesis